MKHRIATIIASLSLALFSQAAQAQAYPSKPIRLVDRNI